MAGRKTFFSEEKKQKTFSKVVLVLFFIARPASAADRLTVILDWFVNPDHAPLLVAQQIGAYAAEGLDVTLVPPSDPAMGPKLVAAGSGDVALTAEPQFLEQVAGGLPVVRIGTLINRPLSTLAVLQGSGISSLADLRGRRIGYGSGQTEQAMVAAMLRTAGLTSADVHMVQIGEQLTVALLSHQVDAATVYRNFEMIELAQHGAPAIGFDYETHGVPTFDELIYVARRDAEHDGRLVRFLRATAKGVVYLRAHPQESWTVFASNHPDLDDALNKAAWFVTLPSFAADPFKLDEVAYESFAKFLLQAGALGPLSPAKTYLVRLNPNR